MERKKKGKVPLSRHHHAPKQIIAVPHITDLSLYDAGLTSIDQIENLPAYTNLQSLNLHSNRIRQIQYLHCIAGSLRELNVSSNSIESMDGIQSLKNLEILNLASNKIRHVTGLGSLRRLKKLVLSFNKIENLDGFQDIREPGSMLLEYLDLRSNRISKVFQLKKLSNLTSIKEFWMSSDVHGGSRAGNAVCLRPDYRAYVFAVLPKLKFLDGLDIRGVPVSEDQRISSASVPNVLEKYSEYLDDESDDEANDENLPVLNEKPKFSAYSPAMYGGYSGANTHLQPYGQFSGMPIHAGMQRAMADGMQVLNIPMGQQTVPMMTDGLSYGPLMMPDGHVVNGYFDTAGNVENEDDPNIVENGENLEEEKMENEKYEEPIQNDRMNELEQQVAMLSDLLKSKPENEEKKEEKRRRKHEKLKRKKEKEAQEEPVRDLEGMEDGMEKEEQGKEEEEKEGGKDKSKKITVKNTAVEQIKPKDTEKEELKQKFEQLQTELTGKIKEKEEENEELKSKINDLERMEYELETALKQTNLEKVSSATMCEEFEEKLKISEEDRDLLAQSNEESSKLLDQLKADLLRSQSEMATIKQKEELVKSESDKREAAIRELRSENDSMKGIMREMEKEHVEQMEGRLRAVQQDTTTALAERDAKHSREIAELSQKNAEELQKRDQAYFSAMSSAREELQTKLSKREASMNKEYEQKIELNKKETSTVLEEVQKEFEKSLGEAKEHISHLEATTKKFAAEKMSLSQELFKLKKAFEEELKRSALSAQKYGELMAKHQQTIKREHQARTIAEDMSEMIKDQQNQIYGLTNKLNSESDAVQETETNLKNSERIRKGLDEAIDTAKVEMEKVTSELELEKKKVSELESALEEAKNGDKDTLTFDETLKIKDMMLADQAEAIAMQKEAMKSKGKQIDELQKELRSIEDNYTEKLERTRRRFDTKLAEKEQSLRSAQETLKSQTQVVEHMESLMGNVNNHIEDLTKRLKEKEDEVKVLEGELDGLNKKISAMEEQWKQESVTIEENVRQEVTTEMKEKSDKYKEEVSETISLLRGEKDKLMSESESYSIKLKNADDELRAVIDAADAQKQILEARIKRLGNALKAMNDEL